MLQFSKYQGLGNDFLLMDRRQIDTGEKQPLIDGDLVRRLCDRRFGIGADGLILALPPRGDGELRMRIFNADGSEPEMCGNGIRCLARFLADSDGDLPGRRWRVETLAGMIVPALEPDGMVRVDMGAPLLHPEAVPTTLAIGPAGLPQGRIEVDGESFEAAAVGMGNPHLVIPVADVASVALERIGAALEVHPSFPARTNVHVVEVLSPDHLLMRVWERGAGITLACGTGACATLVACHRLGLADRQARLDLPGGSLWIDWAETSDHVMMSGPAEAVFDGVVVPSLVEPEGEVPAATSEPAAVASPVSANEVGRIDCATACVNGCMRPDDCASAEARARVAALISSTSLDDLVSLATQSVERRTRARLEQPPGGEA